MDAGKQHGTRWLHPIRPHPTPSTQHPTTHRVSEQTLHRRQQSHFSGPARVPTAKAILQPARSMSATPEPTPKEEVDKNKVSKAIQELRYGLHTHSGPLLGLVVPSRQQRADALPLLTSLLLDRGTRHEAEHSMTPCSSHRTFISLTLSLYHWHHSADQGCLPQ
jgi:hypothetical protein